MNIVTKVFFTCYTYFFYIANTFNRECLELVNFPWYLLYILSARFTIIAETTTFLCMSISKVILNWRLDIYMKLNSSLTINLASLCVIILIVIDMVIRIDMHLYGNCEDRIAIVGYQIEFQRNMCIPESYNTTDNMLGVGILSSIILYSYKNWVINFHKTKLLIELKNLKCRQ